MSIVHKQDHIIKYFLNKRIYINDKDLIFKGCEMGIDEYSLSLLIKTDVYFFSEIYVDALTKCIDLNRMELTVYLDTIYEKYKKSASYNFIDSCDILNNEEFEEFEEFTDMNEID